MPLQEIGMIWSPFELLLNELITITKVLKKSIAGLSYWLKITCVIAKGIVGFFCPKNRP
jgi:hypothetical protein